MQNSEVPWCLHPCLILATELKNIRFISYTETQWYRERTRNEGYHCETTELSKEEGNLGKFCDICHFVFLVVITQTEEYLKLKNDILMKNSIPQSVLVDKNVYGAGVTQTSSLSNLEWSSCLPVRMIINSE